MQDHLFELRLVNSPTWEKRHDTVTIFQIPECEPYDCCKTPVKQGPALQSRCRTASGPSIRQGVHSRSKTVPVYRPHYTLGNVGRCPGPPDVRGTYHASISTIIDPWVLFT
jgi:hypothetical protein